MGDWTLRGDGLRSSRGGIVEGSSSVATLTAPSVNNTKSAYTQLIGSLSFDATGIFVMFFASTSGRSYLVDVALGAAGSEQILLNNLFVARSSQNELHHFFFPVRVPANSRIAARYQASVATAVVGMGIVALAHGWLPSSPFGRVQTLGADTSDSGGTQVVPGASNTKGNYAQLTASTSQPIRSMIISIQNSAGDFTFGNTFNTIDVAVGAAGAERIILPDLFVWGDSVLDCFSPLIIGPLPVQIPAASRVAMRAQSNAASPDNMDVVIYGCG